VSSASQSAFIILNIIRLLIEQVMIANLVFLGHHSSSSIECALCSSVELTETHLHITSQILKQLAEIGPVLSAERVGDSRKTICTVTSYFGIGGLRSSRVNHANVVVQQHVRNNCLQ